MPVSSGIGNAIAGLPIPKSMQQFFLATSREGMAAILPLEASVIIGRTATETKRSGFLGFQERFPEESAAAFIWLFGVRLLQQLFDRFKVSLFPKNMHLSGDIAWNWPWRKRTHIDLSAQEMFTRNAEELSRLVPIKALRLLLSVGLALAGVAYIVPKLNQWKTNWILRNFYEGKGLDPNRGEITPSGVGRPMPSAYAGVPKSAPASIGQPFATPANLTSNPPTIFQHFQTNSNYPPSQRPISTFPFVNGSRSNFTQERQFNPQPQFAALGSLGRDMLQGLGYSVEQTVYGNILVVDTGIVTGRVAASRNQYEGLEITFRDIASLYFYILCAPHIMKLFSKALDPAFGTHILLQPKVAEEMMRTIENRLKQRMQAWLAQEQDPGKRATMQAALERGAIPRDWVPALIRGSANPTLLNPMSHLKVSLRTAETQGPQGFMSLFEKELKAYGWQDGPKKTLSKTLAAVLDIAGEKVSGQAWTTERLARLLTDIEDKRGIFASLSKAQQQELTVALKNAYRHSAGLTVDLSGPIPLLNGQPLDKAPGFAEVWSGWSEQERAGVMHQLRRTAKIDNLDQLSTILRRSLNLFREPLVEHPGLMAQIEMYSEWLNKAVGQHLNLSELIAQELSEMQSALERHGLLKPGQILTPESLRNIAHALPQHHVWGARRLSSRVSELNGLLEGVTSDRPLAAQVRERMSATLDEMFKQAQLDDHVRPILEEYRAMIRERIAETRGQLFSMSISDSDPALEAKLREILAGGLKNDITFRKQGQSILGEAVTDPRRFDNPAKIQRLEASIAAYGEKLIQRLEGETAEEIADLPRLVQWKAVADHFWKLNRNLNYGARLISMTVAVIGLGLAVPKIQYGITRVLTGRDENPGIASAERAVLNQKNALSS